MTCEYMAQQEGVLCEEVLLLSESNDDVCVKVKVHARVMGKVHEHVQVPPCDLMSYFVLMLQAGKNIWLVRCCPLVVLLDLFFPSTFFLFCCPASFKFIIGILKKAQLNLLVISIFCIYNTFASLCFVLYKMMLL